MNLQDFQAEAAEALASNEEGKGAFIEKWVPLLSNKLLELLEENQRLIMESHSGDIPDSDNENGT